MPWSAADGVCPGNARRPGARLLRPVVVRERAPAQQQAGLVFFLEQAGGLLAGDRGLRQILMFATHGRDRVG
jgi:hypothetical protein